DSLCLFLSRTPPAPPSTLFPYTTLFRSRLIPSVAMPSTAAPHCASTVSSVLRSALSPLLRHVRPGGLASRNFSLPPWPTSQAPRSEEHTSELQSRGHLVCRLLLAKKKSA